LDIKTFTLISEDLAASTFREVCTLTFVTIYNVSSLRRTQSSSSLLRGSELSQIFWKYLVYNISILSNNGVTQGGLLQQHSCTVPVV